MNRQVPLAEVELQLRRQVAMQPMSTLNVELILTAIEAPHVISEAGQRELGRLFGAHPEMRADVERLRARNKGAIRE